MEDQDTARIHQHQDPCQAFKALIICPRCGRNGREADFQIVGLTADPPVGAFGVPLIISSTAITNFAPHPNAAKLFTKPKLSELKILPLDPEELERKTEEIKKRFVELFGA